MTDKLTELQNKLEKLEIENSKIKKELETNTNESLSVGIELLKSNSTSLKVRYDNLQRQFLVLSQKLTKVKEECHQLQIEIERLQ